ncbi:MAG TPA: NADH-quinone oxidoreductase subunit F, partial [Dehalococcoidia bacterium]|nr:NADH-quinone oxidoreductase subunit F [Dehalococcoidia bacterium]
MTFTASPDVAAAFKGLKEHALSRWQTLWDGTKPVIMVSAATCGRAAGALEVLQAIRDELGKEQDGVRVIEVGCMGHCYAEPLVIIAKPGYPEIAYGYVTPEIARRLVKDYIRGGDVSPEFILGAFEPNELVPSIYDLPRFRHEKYFILENIGRIDPEDIYHYIAKGGYEALAKALQMQPEDIIGEVRESGLRGRGGAGFPTAKKWEICRSARSKAKYLICNADEGDPGAFMDRAILESDPHSVIEGMVIAAYAVGAHYSYIYVRAEY